MPHDLNQLDRSKVTPNSSRGTVHPTACLACRQARQKCDRQEPCLRCRCHSLDCTYPARSNRGRKRGSTNKPDTVEKLLSRINDSSVRDDVINFIVKRHTGESSSDLDALSEVTRGFKNERNDNERDEGPYGGNDVQETLYSPLQILAAAVVAEKDQQSNLSSAQASSAPSEAGGDGLGDLTGWKRKAKSSLVDERLSKYFAPRFVDRTDWEVLNSMPEDSKFRLDPATREPVAAGLIDNNDVVLYFDLFFTIRNPMIGLLDPELHTPLYVRSQSFTLFSVVCALGSAVSGRPRDRLLHPVLASLAEENIKWSIAASVKSVEIVQAIVDMTYYNATHERLADDPYWLRVSHATQLAREIGLHRPSVILQKVNALRLSSNEEKERVVRNYQRTWLYVFVVDKSFGMTTGRTISVSYRDVPTNISEWGQRPTASVFDRLIVNCVDQRIIVVKAFEKRRRLPRDRQSIINWQRETFSTIESLRAERCRPDNQPSAEFLPVLAFYIDHGLMAINAHASRDLISIDGNEASQELATMSKQTMEVAMRFIDGIISDPVMVRLMLGLHNTQFIMISHAATEVIHAIKRSLSAEDAMRASTKIRLLANHIENVANALPPTSWASLYLRLFRFFVAQLEEVTAVRESKARQDDVNESFTDWWKFVDIDSFDFASGIDMGFMDADPQMMGTGWEFEF